MVQLGRRWGKASLHALEIACHFLEVGKKLLSRLLPSLGRGPKHCRRVDCSHNRLGELGRNRPTPILGHPELFSQQRLRRGGSKRHNHARLHHADLLLKPRVAGAHFGGAGLLVQPAAPLDYHELEMLYGISDVHPSPIDPRCLQRRIQQLTRRTHERMTLTIFLVPRLFVT